MPGFREYEVPLPLQGLIRTLHYFEMDFGHPFPGQPAAYITCLANTEQNLYLLPCDPLRVVAASGQSFPAPPAIITGPKDRPVGLAFGNNHLMIKLAFYPTALYRLTCMDMQQTVNMGLDASLFFSRTDDCLTAVGPPTTSGGGANIDHPGFRANSYGAKMPARRANRSGSPRYA